MTAWSGGSGLDRGVRRVPDAGFVDRPALDAGKAFALGKRDGLERRVAERARRGPVRVWIDFPHQAHVVQRCLVAARPGTLEPDAERGVFELHEIRSLHDERSGLPAARRGRHRRDHGTDLDPVGEKNHPHVAARIVEPRPVIEVQEVTRPGVEALVQRLRQETVPVERQNVVVRRTGRHRRRRRVPCRRSRRRPARCPASPGSLRERDVVERRVGDRNARHRTRLDARSVFLRQPNVGDRRLSAARASSLETDRQRLAVMPR